MNNYSELSIVLKKLRSIKEQTATRFWSNNKKNLGVSYEAFKHYENGERIPSIEYLRRIAPLIGSEYRTLCHLWARAQMPDDESKSFFDGAPGFSANISTRAKPEEIYRFSRSDVKNLLESPQLYMVSVFMAAYHDSKPFSVSEIMKFSELNKTETKKLINTLMDMGLVVSINKDQYKSRYKVFDIPRDDEFFKPIRDKNFKTFGDKVLKNFSTEKRNRGEAQRFTFSTRLTPELQRMIQSKLSELESHFDTIPAGNGERMGTVCVAFSDYVSRRGDN